MRPEDLQRRTKRFALDAMGFFRLLPNEPVSMILGKQLVRCATSVGANYRSACLAKSPADMVSKLKTVEEEADEAAFWLELIDEGGILPHAETEPLHQEAVEIRKIMSASIKTLRSRPRR
jgi:four helix bundle protein